MRKINEECGVFGIFSPTRDMLADDVYYGLFALQHRGQESCGISVNDDGVFTTYKNRGIVNDVFTRERLDSLGMGNIAVGHVRYASSGTEGNENSQPTVINHIKGRMAIAHNGNIVNSYKLREELELCGSIFHTSSDTEVIAYLITKERLAAPSIEEALNRAMSRIEGAFSLVLMSPTKLIAARDEMGFRPLCMGMTENGSYVFASETCALDAANARFLRDLEPGEIVVVDKNGIRSIKDHCNKKPKKLCVFEYIYFARPDSVVDGCSVHNARLRAGEFLAVDSPVDADVVIGVPDSGIDAAIGYARRSGIPYGLGFIKNKYIGRTFIAPNQKYRENRVRIKLNPISDTVKGKRVVLIDDSIVRGTTSARIVKLLREAGATEVHMRVSAPPFTDPCYYGTDIDSKEVLIANNHTVAEIAEIVGVDSLAYLSYQRLDEVAAPNGGCICTSCFDGKYPTSVPSHNKKYRYDKKISESEE